MNSDFHTAQQFVRNLVSYDETPLASNEDELVMAINIIKKRQSLIWQAFRGHQKNSDVQKIY